MLRGMNRSCDCKWLPLPFQQHKVLGRHIKRIQQRGSATIQPYVPRRLVGSNIERRRKNTGKTSLRDQEDPRGILNPTGGITVTFVDQGLILQTIAPNDDDEHPDLSMLLAKSIGSSFKNWMAINIRFRRFSFLSEP